MRKAGLSVPIDAKGTTEVTSWAFSLFPDLSGDSRG